jgi:hypothetical protein
MQTKGKTLPATLMRRQLLIILTLLTIKSYGQCGREYPSGFYHNSKILNAQGDTLNRLDNSGLYHGLHLYTDNSENIYSDTNSFIIGMFEHGLPVGEWKDHCKDGSFSRGQFSCGGGESSSDGKGGWVTKHQGIYVKIGIWKYFDKDSQIIKTERYDRSIYKNGWADKTFIADSNGNFILVKFESKYNYSTKRKRETTKIYTDKGVPVSADYESFWKDISYEYDQNGQVSKIIKRKKFFGKTLKTTIEKEYNSKGQLKCKTKTKCKHPDSHIMINHAW